MTQVNSSVVDDILNKLPKKYKKKILEEELPFSIEYNPKNIGDKYILLRDFGHIIEISWRKRTEDKDDERHREDGPAIEWSNGTKEWWLEGKRYSPVNLKDFVVLDHNMGKYGLIWYKLLDKDKVFECPDIPGLFEK